MDSPVDDWTNRSLLLRCDGIHPVSNGTATRTLFSMDGRPISRFEFRPQFLSLYYYCKSSANALRDRFAFWPAEKRKREKEKKRKSITIRWNSSNCPRRESSFAQRCAMKPYSPLRGVLPLWMPIRERDRANADNNVLLVHRIISGREGKKRKKKEAKEKSWIKFSKARVSIHRTLIYATLVHAYWACSNDSVAVVTWLITFTVKFCDKMLR